MLKKVKELRSGDVVIAEDNGEHLNVESVMNGSKRNTIQISFTNGEYAIVPTDFTVEVVIDEVMTNETLEPAPAPGRSAITHDHATIKNWANNRGGQPVIVKGTDSVLRIDFPGGAGEESFVPVSWKEWFKIFDKLELQFLYQDTKKNGEQSTFFRLIRSTEE